ncbi:MAG TPA: M23 family metallopeptidase [Acidimicrobiales bacterium]|nr:M23 family metallopeptidase [Acidimicrobiales bacterium]
MRTPATNTAALLEALQELEQFGVSIEDAAVIGFGRFPVGGQASYSHDWWFPRFGPGWRLHEGTDIFAPMGTPVRAPVDGTIRITDGGLGGLSVYVDQPDGTYWYLTHLSGIGPGIEIESSVVTGQVVGYVGNSGNARTTPPHLHIQIHPRGGRPIDPKPVLDKFISDALAAVPELVAAYAAAAAAGNLDDTGRPAVEVATPAAVELPEPDDLELGPPRSALLWASSVSPTGGALQLAEAEAARAAANIDWVSLASVQLAARADRADVEREVNAWLRPLLPPALALVVLEG